MTEHTYDVTMPHKELVTFRSHCYSEPGTTAPSQCTHTRLDSGSIWIPTVPYPSRARELVPQQQRGGPHFVPRGGAHRLSSNGPDTNSQGDNVCCPGARTFRPFSVLLFSFFPVTLAGSTELEAPHHGGSLGMWAGIREAAGDALCGGPTSGGGDTAVRRNTDKVVIL